MAIAEYYTGLFHAQNDDSVIYDTAAEYYVEYSTVYREPHSDGRSRGSYVEADVTLISAKLGDLELTRKQLVKAFGEAAVRDQETECADLMEEGA